METYPNKPELWSKQGTGTGLALLCKMNIIYSQLDPTHVKKSFILRDVSQNSGGEGG